MLKAWARGKRRAFRGESEDEIVSSIFGSVGYLSPSLRVTFFTELLYAIAENGPEASLRDKTCTSVEVDLWPNLADSGRVEPDVIIKSEDIIIMIEAKWDSPQSENQLSSQWCAAKIKYKVPAMYHLFLTKEPKGMEEMLGVNPDGEHSKHLYSMTWSRLAHVTNRLAKNSNDELKNWASDVRTFLTRLGHAPFIGVLAICKEHSWPSPGDTWRFQPLLIRFEDLMSRHSNLIRHGFRPVWLFTNS